MLPVLFWLSMAFLAGILLAAYVHLSVFIWLTLAVVAVVLLILRPVFWPPEPYPSLSRAQPPSPGHPPTSVLFFVSLLFVFFGAVRYQLTVPSRSITQVEWFNDRDYSLLVTGTLVDPPDVRDTYTNLRLRAQVVDTGADQFPVNGLVLARVPANYIYQYGQNVRLRGHLETPPEDEDFSYRDYLARQNIRSYMPDAEVTVLPGSSANPALAAVYSLKAKLLDNIYRLFIDPEASLLAGILLGIDAGLPQPLQQAFNDTGTSHIIAISGFNIAIITGIFMLIFSKLLGPRRGAVAAVIGVLFYTVLVGADPSVVRAALMGMISLFAVQVGRRQVGLNTLAFVAALMTIWNPLFLWDVGFQLSFFATLGLVLYADPFESAVENFLRRYLPPSNAVRVTGFLAEVVLLTVAAQITTLPIMAYHFKQISLVSFIANPFILPAQPAVMVLGGLAAFSSLFIFPLGRLLALIAWPLTAYTIRMVEFFDSLPHGVLYLGSFSVAFVLLFYAVLFGVTLGGASLKQAYNSLRSRFSFITAGVVLAALFICALLAWRLAAAGPDGKLHVIFNSVGSADSVLIQSPTGRYLLVDGGPSSSALSDALGRRISPLAPALDWLIIASPEESQVAALPRILPRYPPRNALVAGNAGASNSSHLVMQWLDEQSVPVTQAETGQLLDLGDGALLRVVDVSPQGASLLVTWNDFHMLLPIGANLDTLSALQDGAAIGPIEALSLSQSGYAPLTPPSLIENLNPQLVVISVAAGDPDGRPDQDTLKALAGRSVMRTDVNGWIDVASDGTKMWVTAQRNPQPVQGLQTPTSTSPHP